MFTGTVTAIGGSGFWFIEQDQTRDNIFVHQRNVVRKKFLHVNDRVRFNLTPSPRIAGEMEAVDVEIIGLTSARQINAPGNPEVSR